MFYVATRVRPVRVGLSLPILLNHSLRYIASGRERISSDTLRMQGELIGMTTRIRQEVIDCLKSTIVARR